MKPRIQLAVSIDTEEDNWLPTREGVRVDNIQALPEHHRFLCDLGLRPTYFVNYAVAADPAAGRVIAKLAQSGEGEVAAHLHPWNTPPISEPMQPGNTMLCNLPRSLQRAKVAVVAEALQAVTGERPTVFRAGRFGLGAESLGAIHDEGFEIDSSVTPGISWRDCDEGPEFCGAPRHCYRLAPDSDPCLPDASGPLCEVPISAGFTRAPFAWRERLRRRLHTSGLRKLHLESILERLDVARNVLGCPEASDLDDMVRMSRALVESGVPYLLLVWHSPSLQPGLSPFVQSDDDLRALRRKIERYVEAIGDFAEIEGATVSEIADRHAPPLADAR